jgi:hypothetical protein
MAVLAEGSFLGFSGFITIKTNIWMESNKVNPNGADQIGVSS